ncbi:amino acid ABC transporter [Aerococcus urinaehominis]|uniref:Amino acid ABC transporter n=1 Tax=Aerococcus urinaehominis TaxID=128944 RepID=A0A109RH43_9LACT|nr:branched-chain amino acid ABC transporter permease [Aerococcus urinaehominis]AMB99849.1 amino acid ABC transporter [Aerococcus urinaehominis]SDM63669.1 amino acid/amide ABC transporter membrane protein 2, HAAT family (TC 3.A.1.4.-) [Aerococcus urinaehominis]
MSFLNPYYLQVAMFALINAIAAISVFIVLQSGQVSLGSAGFMSIGAYTSAILTMNYNVPMFLSILIGAIVAAVVSLIIGVPTTKLSGLYLTIATIGFSEVVRVLFLNLEITNGALGLSGIPSLGQEVTNLLAGWGLLNTGIQYNQLQSLVQIVIVALIMAVIVYLWLNLEQSKIGRAFLAVKADNHAAELAGINVAKYKLTSFVLSAFVAGVAGALFAHATNFINPGDFDFSLSVDNLLCVVFGGSDVIWGPILGSIVLTALPEMLRFMAEWRDMIYGILLVLLLIFRTDGIITVDMVRRLRAKRQAGKTPDYVTANQKDKEGA